MTQQGNFDKSNTRSNFDDGSEESGLVRMNLNVIPGVPDKLRELAGGRFKMGSWLSELIEQMYANRGQAEQVQSMELEGLRLLMMGMAGQLASVRGEVAHLQATVAALIAKG